MTAPQPNWAQAPDGTWHAVPSPAPPSKKRGSGWVIGIVVVLLLLGSLVVVLALAPKDSTNGAAGTTVTTREITAVPTTAPPATPGSGLTKETAAPPGQPVSPAKDWLIMVSGPPVLNANAQLAAVNQFNTPPPGKTFVLVPIAVENHGATPQATSSNLKVTILLPSGVAIDEALCGVVPNSMDLSAQVQPGGSNTGTLCFAVPSEVAGPGLFLLAEPTFTLDPVKDQRFMALP